MKNGIIIAFVYIGLVIGAGFASGKEVMHFFNRFGDKSVYGIILASSIFIFIAYIIMKKAFEFNIYSFFEYVDVVGGRFGSLFKLIIILFMFSGFCVMMSAGGVMAKNIFGLNEGFGIIFLLLICFIVFIFNARGIVTLNSILTPIMIAGIVYIGIISYFSDGSVFMEEMGIIKNIKDNFFIYAVCYVSYNTITAAAVLVPLREYFDNKSIKIGALFGGGILGVLIFSIWFAIRVYYNNVYDAEMPMFYIAEINGEIYKYLYGAVLYMAIITTAVSEGFGIISMFPLKKNYLQQKKESAIRSAILCLAAVPVSFFKFSDLVENLYTLFGYLGILWMAVIIYDYFKICMKKNS